MKRKYINIILNLRHNKLKKDKRNDENACFYAVKHGFVDKKVHESSLFYINSMCIHIKIK